MSTSTATSAPPAPPPSVSTTASVSPASPLPAPSQNHTQTTPKRHVSYYASPHTPIASAKRPREPSSLRKQRSSSGSISGIPEGRTDERLEENQVLSPPPAIDLTRSPLHPPRIMVGHDSAVACERIGNKMKISPSNTTNRGSSWTGVVGADAGDGFAVDDESDEDRNFLQRGMMNALFSPVLHFFGPDGTIIDGPVESANVDANGHSIGGDAFTNVTETSPPPTVVNRSISINDMDTACEERKATEEISKVVSITNFDVDVAQSDKTDDMGSVETDVIDRPEIIVPSVGTVLQSEKKNEEVIENQQHQVLSSTTSSSLLPINEDTDVEMDEDVGGNNCGYHLEVAEGHGCEEEDSLGDEYEEFNPYLFIKQLPNYELVTIPNKICLPPKSPHDKPISLVLDLDETLVHCTVEPIPNPDMVFPVEFGGAEYQVHVRKRPYLEYFLGRVSQHFEVIVFTASQKVYADELLNRLDPEGKYIKHRMFRESCLPVEGNYLKDLNVLGRNLTQAVLVDNSPHAFGYQVDNGIPIESWFDDPNDSELVKLEVFLSTLIGVTDVRPIVRDKFQTFKLIHDA
mmetsp:Transcript_14515/g.31922  ORF Transcript_14515/g.31922 Transcript_14515/m.31922 type:complete len:574 (-) Transcript_14515:234-1955(-)